MNRQLICSKFQPAWICRSWFSLLLYAAVLLFTCIWADFAGGGRILWNLKVYRLRQQKALSWCPPDKSVVSLPNLPTFSPKQTDCLHKCAVGKIYWSALLFFFLNWNIDFSQQNGSFCLPPMLRETRHEMPCLRLLEVSRRQSQRLLKSCCIVLSWKTGK